LYGLWIVSGGYAFLPEVNDGKSPSQKKAIRMFCISWMAQFFIAYSLPLWYAYMPDKVETHRKILKTMTTIDSVLSVSLLFLTMLLFNANWITSAPMLTKITEVPPTTEPLWIYDQTSQDSLYNYMFDIANNKSIPTVVIYRRPIRSYGLWGSQGKASDWADYTEIMNDIAETFQKVDYPAIVVLEPGLFKEIMWNAESGAGTENTVSYTVTVNGTTLSGISVNWDPESFYRAMDIFIAFSLKMNPLTRVYLSVEDPYYLEGLTYEPLRLVSENIRDTPIRGVVFNAASYYPSDLIVETGIYAAEEYDLWWAYDSSRNGGDWSLGDIEEIEACRFDPPATAVGYSPMWPDYWKEVANEQGADGRFWISMMGLSDGRLYEAGTKHSCLEDHDIACSDFCPEISYFHSYKCRCE